MNKPETPNRVASSAGLGSTTPKTDEDVRLCKVISQSFGPMVGADFARQLENDLNETGKALNEMAQRAERLEAKLKDVIAWLGFYGPVGVTPDSAKLLENEIRALVLPNNRLKNNEHTIPPLYETHGKTTCVTQNGVDACGQGTQAT